MVQADTEAQRLPENIIFNSGEVQLKIILRHTDPTTRIVFHSNIVNQILRGQPCLSPRCNENDDRLFGRVILDRKKGGSIHRLHQRAEPSLVREAVDEYFEWHRSNRVSEVEKSFLDS